MTPPAKQARWEALKLDVAHASIVMDMAFASTLRLWQSGESSEWDVRETGDLSSPLVCGPKSKVLIEGDCLADLSLAEGSLVHVCGDLGARLTLGGHSQVIIGGDILPRASIEATGITQVFVGGDVDGTIRGSSSLKIATNGNLQGLISTGHPSTHLRVGGEVVGVHERNALAVGHHLDDVAGEQYPSAFCASGPMQHGATLEMPTATDQGQAVAKAVRFSLPEDDVFVGTHQSTGETAALSLLGCSRIFLSLDAIMNKPDILPPVLRRLRVDSRLQIALRNCSIKLSVSVLADRF